MNEEYPRLEAEAIEVEARIAGLIGAATDTNGVRQESELSQRQQIVRQHGDHVIPTC